MSRSVSSSAVVRGLRRASVVWVLLISLVWADGVRAGDSTAADLGDEPALSEARASQTFGEKLLWYLPNRIFDALDIVRLRVRVGPGIAVGARVTEAVDVGIGAYSTLFAGAPGPRGRSRANCPLGIEDYVGAEVSVAGGESENEPTGPNYGALEVGVGFQAAIVGLDFGIDPGEILDLGLGFLFLDIIPDDL